MKEYQEIKYFHDVDHDADSKINILELNLQSIQNL